VAHIAWLGKKSPFCGNVSYGLSTTERLQQLGHRISFIHFDNPSSGLGFGWDGLQLEGRQTRGSAESRSSAVGRSEGDSGDVALPYLVKSQAYTIPSPGAQRELRESLEQLKPDLVHASLTLSPLDFRLPDLCQHLGVPLVATFHPAFDAGLRNLSAGTQQLTYQIYAPTLAKFDRVIVFSDRQAELLARLGVREERLAVIPNGVDTDRWQPAPTGAITAELAQLRRRFQGRRVFLYMGRLARRRTWRPC